MTSQTKRYVELADFLSLKLTCKGCGSSLEIPISRNISSREDIQKLDACPICLKPWANLGGTTLHPIIAGLPLALKKLSETLEASAPGFSLTIEVTDEEAKP